MKKNCLWMILVVHFCSNAEILHTINKNSEWSSQNVAKTATIGFSRVLKVSKCCRDGNIYGPGNHRVKYAVRLFEIILSAPKISSTFSFHV